MLDTAGSLLGRRALSWVWEREGCHIAVLVWSSVAGCNILVNCRP